MAIDHNAGTHLFSVAELTVAVLVERAEQCPQRMVSVMIGEHGSIHAQRMPGLQLPSHQPFTVHQVTGAYPAAHEADHDQFVRMGSQLTGCGRGTYR